MILDVGAVPGALGRVTLRLNSLIRKMLAVPSPRLLDLLEIACYVYAADLATRRDTPTMLSMGERWRRDFHFSIAVRDPSFWGGDDIRQDLAATLGFLSDDAYAFKFSQQRTRNESHSFLEFATDGPGAGFVPDEVMMFSGGLDSFAGAVEAVLQSNKRVALVSHHASPLVVGVQRKLLAALTKRVGSGRMLHITVGVTKSSNRTVEFTQRSRSFLFAVLGFVVARLFDRQEINFYENGIVSLNLPLAEHVVGGRATRTTHPRVLREFSALFSRVASRDIRVGNPFFWSTKAEVVRKIADAGCGDLIPMTFSCANVRAATRMAGRHCGVCSQCLDRRFGVLAADCGRFEPAEKYDVDLFRGPRKPGLDTIMAESYVLAANRHADASELAFLARYGEVFRAVTYIDGMSAAATMGRLHRLHQRHGQAVRAVIGQQINPVNLVEDRLHLPDSSLLAMMMGQQSQDVACIDPVEAERPSVDQAVERSLGLIPRPIPFAVEGDPARAVFATPGISLRGRSAQLINALFPNFRACILGLEGASEVRFMKATQLQQELEVNDPALRAIVTRARADLAAKFRLVFGAELQEDDIIESHPWQGYRLNPHLAFAPVLLLRGGIETAAE